MSDIAIADESSLSSVDEEQLVTMMVDDQLFGIPILVVQDIVEPDQITPVPRAPSAIAGVLNLRGRIVTVIDLRECLGAKPLDGAAKQMSVTVEYKGDLYTLLVDSIGDVRSLPRKSFDKPPTTLDENLKRVCSGIFRLEENLLVVLDVERILDEETILKTPRRTRRRMDMAANRNIKANTRAKVEAKGDMAKKSKKPVEETQDAAKRHDTTKRQVKKPDQAEKTGTVDKSEDILTTADGEKTSEPGVFAKDLPPSDDAESTALKAVEAFAGRIDADPILAGLFKDVDDTKMLDLLEALFRAVFNVAGGGSLESAYLALIQQPELGDDHFVAAATAMHAVLTELGVSNEESDRVMRVIDQTRIKLLDT